MVQVTSREFRSNQSAVFARADAGEQVIIRRRGKQNYMLVPVSDDEIEVSPELHARIMAAREQHEKGTARKFTSAESLLHWLDSL